MGSLWWQRGGEGRLAQTERLSTGETASITLTDRDTQTLAIVFRVHEIHMSSAVSEAPEVQVH